MPFSEALFNAIKDAKVTDVARYLIDIKDDVNALANDQFNELSPLMYAIFGSSSDSEESKRIVQLIMDHPLTRINVKTPQQATAIHAAALQGSLELMQTVLTKARIQATEEGSNPDEVLGELINLAAHLPQDEDEDEDEDDTLTLQTPLYL